MVVIGSGCTAESGATTDAAGTTGGATGDATGEATTTTATTTGEPTTGETTSAGTTGEPASYCHGFDAGAAMPFLELHILGGELLVDGTTLPLECGGQGLWMFGLYPGLGGWDPGADTIKFAVEVDVEGYNDNPAGHFFSGDVPYYIGCEELEGGVFGVVPVLPPDTLADLSVLDGKPATVRVSVPAGGQVLMAEASVTLSAPSELVQLGCGFG